LTRRIGTIALSVIIAGFVFIGWDYLHYRSVNAVSNAAFVRSDSLAMLGFKLGGKIITMAKEEGESFKKGELLAQLDDVYYRLEAKKLAHTIAASENSLKALQSRFDRLSKTLDLQNEQAQNSVKSAGKQLEAAKSGIVQLEAQYAQAKRDLERLKSLQKKRLIDAHSVEQARLKATTLQQQLKSARINKGNSAISLDSAQKNAQMAKLNLKQLDELSAQIDGQNESILAMKVSLESLNQKIADCRLRAPFEGKVAKKFTAAGSVIGKGTPIYAAVDLQSIHLEVMLEEKKLYGIRPGNSVDITIDAIPDGYFKGKVERILPASASTFSLVPRDIASGEFTKLAQRFIVRIVFEEHDGLLPGMSAEVAISRSK